MTTPRSLPTATLLNDGRVLIAGGEDPQTILSSAEIYTPSVLVPAPALLSLSGDGQGQGAIQHAGTTRIASAADPAVTGEYLSIYLTGLADGSVIPPQVAIGGAPAGFGVIGSISPDVMEEIIVEGGGDPLRNISAEQWVVYFRQVVPQ